MYGTILYDEVDESDAAVRQRNVTVFADGQVDRSPCGSGTAARLATLAAEGRLDATRSTLVHDSIVGSTFTATITASTEIAGRSAVVPRITGTSFRTGEHRFHVDPADDLVPGFVLR